MACQCLRAQHVSAIHKRISTQAQVRVEKFGALGLFQEAAACATAAPQQAKLKRAAMTLCRINALPCVRSFAV
jgi:hypothetical protein